MAEDQFDNFGESAPISQAFREYCYAAVRTEARIRIHSGDLTETLSIERDLRLLHAAIGLAGELIEFREAIGRIKPQDGKFDSTKLTCRTKGDKWLELAGELGDMLWYTGMLAIIQGAEDMEMGPNAFSRIATVPGDTLLGKSLRLLDTLVCDIVDNVKGLVYYHRDNIERRDECSRRLRGLIPDMVFVLGVLFDCYFTSEDKSPWGNVKFLMRSNIAKLQQRYPEKFTSDAAANRDTDAEFKAIATAE